jgi:hypothetical protein
MSFAPPPFADRAAFEAERAKWLPCAHLNTSPRRKWKNVKGKALPYFKFQCLDCCKAMSSQLSFALIEGFIAAGQAVEDWDPEAEDRYAEQAMSFYQHVRDEGRASWWRQYERHLSSDKWQQTRRLVFQRARWTCEWCHEARATQVHHLSYEHVGCENLAELLAVCVACHDGIHGVNE